jgi:hypothetical protein
VLRGMFVRKNDQVTGDWTKMRDEEICGRLVTSGRV